MTAGGQDEDKAKDQLMNELAALRQRIAELEASETEHKRAEEATKLAYAQLSRIFDTASDGMWVIDKDFNVLRISETFSTLSGIGKNEAVGKKCHILFGGSLCHTPSCPLTRILGGEERVECDVEKERNDGIRIPCIVTAVPFRGSGGELIGIVENFKDLTERRRAEEAVKESERRYRDLFDSASDAIFVRDLEGNIIEVNQAAATLTGYTLDELSRMNISELLTAESFQIAMERQQRQLEGETASQRYELELVSKDGTKAIIESVIRLITENGQAVGVQAMVRDGTELKRWRENMLFYISEITRAQEEERKRIARELHDETAQALATLSLDIETITRARERLSEETLQQLEQLRDKIEPIMEGVRRFSHELRPGALDQLGLLPALESLAEDMIVSYEIDARVEVIATPRRLSAEEELVLFRIAQEALSNVRKHSQATEAVVRVEFCDDKIRMAITDNGQGFELPDMLSDFVAKGKLGILGMHERARLLDGSFSVQSEVGKGTTMSVEIAG